MKNSKPVIFITLWIIILLPFTLFSQWEFEEVFPDPTNPSINQTGGMHGLAVDPDGKIWAINYFAYDRDLIYVAANQNQYIPVRAVYVFNPDGTPTSFSPILFLTINGVTDTLGGYTTNINTWEPRTGRGMRMDPDGNIVVAMYDTYYKINYLTGEGISKVTPIPGVVATAPAFSENGHMFTAGVLPGNTVKEYDENFKFLGDVLNNTIGYSRAFEVGGDGLTLYWAGYTNNCVYKYTRPNPSSPFNDSTIILKGFAAESFAWYPNTNILWASAGSGTDLPNQYPDTLTYYSYCTWYGYNVESNMITDSIKWNNIIDPASQRPRAITFSADGYTAYVGMFGNIYLDGIQKFTAPLPVHVVRPNGEEVFSIGYTDTIKWTATISDVKLEYSTDSGNTWNIIENTIPAVTGKYSWLVPNVPSENSLVRISDVTDPLVFDVSDNVFTISEPPVITVLPDSINVVLNEGDSTTSIMQISNSGLGNLFYEISIENVSDKSKSPKRISSPNSPTMWRESFLNAREQRVKKFKGNPYKNNLPESVLPLIISDPAGDGGLVDIIQIRGGSTADSIKLELVFETDLNPFDFGGYIGLDIDQNVFTGQPLPFGLPEQEVGCEYFIDFFSLSSNSIYVYDKFFNYIGNYPIEIDLHSFRFSIPLSSLENDDGIMNLASVVGNGSGPTDWIPDQGYGVLSGNAWLTIEPLSGTISPSNSEVITVKFKTEDIEGGEFYANILISSNDPVNQLVSIPVHLTVIVQPNLVSIDSANFGQVYVGYPDSVQLELKNNGSVTLQVTDIQSSNILFTIQGNSSFNVEPLGTYQLPILFTPVSAGFEIGTLSIISNDPSSPEVINLTGEGILPPFITISPDSFFYDLNVGDSITTQLTIDNSNGLGELTFQISDRMVAGKTKSKNQANHYIKQKNGSVDNINFFGIDPTSFSNFHKKTIVATNSLNQLDNGELKMLLPLIFEDIKGDGGIADIQEIRGRVFNNSLEIEYVFADGINISDSLLALLYLDIDRDPFTGITDSVIFHDLGVDYFIDYYPLYFGNEIYISEFSTGNSYSVPYVINGTTISYSIPLSFLGNDDGEMDLLALSGYNGEPLDWAPNEGHATLLGDVFWLSENPTSGIIPPGGNMTIEIQANTSELIGGNYIVAIDVQSNDPANPALEIPFSLHLTGVPNISVSPDSLNFGETYIGYHNSLVLKISSSGTDSLFGSIISSDPQFVLQDSVFTLPVGEVKNVEVQFYPADIGIVSAQLTINCNATLIPLTIVLSGEGVIAPNILTNTDILQYQAVSGDTLYSNFLIYNTGGSDLIVDISDEVTDKASGSQRLFAAGSNMIYEINPDNGQIINSFASPIPTSEGPTGLALSGEYLFFTDVFSDYSIYVLDPENGGLITSFPAPSTSSDGLAFIDPYLYVNDYSYGYIYVVDPLRGMIQDTLYPPVYIGGGLDGGNDRLFVSDFNYNIFELNPVDGALVNSFTTNNMVYGIGFTGERLFISLPGAGIDEYDPDTGIFLRSIGTTGYAALAGGGNQNAEWLNENPVQVTIPAGDSVSINLVIIAPDESGHYSADIVLESNDPDSSTARLHVVLDIITGVAEENSLPTVYSLYNNYPNPFNPTTTIKYDIPEQSYVTIKIYNLLGEEVTTLLNEEHNVGRYQINWNAAQLASGVYFYRIQAGSFVDTKKMILMK